MLLAFVCAYVCIWNTTLSCHILLQYTITMWYPHSLIKNVFGVVVNSEHYLLFPLEMIPMSNSLLFKEKNYVSVNIKTESLLLQHFP